MGDAWASVSAISATLGTLVIIAGAIYGHYQLKEARIARNTALLLGLRDRYHSPQTREIRRRLLAREFGPADIFDSDQLTGADFNDFWDLMDQLELVGVLVERKAIDHELVRSVFHRSPPLIWQYVEADIIRRRKQIPYEAKHLELLARSYGDGPGAS